MQLCWTPLQTKLLAGMDAYVHALMSVRVCVRARIDSNWTVRETAGMHACVCANVRVTNDIITKDIANHCLIRKT